MLVSVSTNIVTMLQNQGRVREFVLSYWWRQIIQQFHAVIVRLLLYFRLCSLHHPTTQIKLA